MKKFRYKTLRNRTAKFVLVNAIEGHPRFSFIRLYNCYHDKDFEIKVFNDLFRKCINLCFTCHDVDVVNSAIDTLPIHIKQWILKYNYNSEDYE